MAHYAAAGHEVHVLTCTLGEEGEVIPGELRHLAADQEDALGPWRREELRRAMAALGVTSHAVLGEDPGAGVLSRYRDSGMLGTPSAEHPRAFVRADVGQAAAMVREQVRRLRPDVVVTYDEHGGYGHPDHIQTHRVTLAALAGLGADEPRPTAYCVLTPCSWAREDRAWLAASADVAAHPQLSVPGADAAYPPSVVDDARVTHVVQDPGVVGTQAAALAEHRTQVSVFDGYYALSNDIAARLPGREGFALVDPDTGRLRPRDEGQPGWLPGLLPGEGR
jgi:N-acetyl-1-D-myo-inositol-2-amino-2-deoxy-alpha-D-glucopyranoside deacetylase